MPNGIEKRELRQLIRWITYGTGAFFIYFYLREKIKTTFPNPEVQLVVGLILVGLVAYYFNLTKYGG